ncbi:MAG: TonB-dependent receptor [Bacteroidota bacterium]
MKLTAFLSMMTIFHLFATETYSQLTKLTLKFEDVKISDALKEIENQSEFFFLYSPKLIDVERKVSIEADKEPIKDILSEIFGSDVSFIVSDRQIVLTSTQGSSALEALLQQQPVTGKITDASTGEAMPGVNIQIKGTTNGTIADASGKYSLNVTDPNAILIFSFIGYGTKEVPIAGKAVIDLELAAEVIGLDEVVVTGYGVQKKVEITGSISVVSPKDIVNIPTSNPIQALQGRVPGLYLTEDGTPGGGTRTTIIRGRNTLGNTEPLYIIDGQPVGGEKMDVLDPNTIESLQVLKDATAASIYGSRASNGVIIITTKRAKGKGVKVEISSYASLQKLYSIPDMLNTEQRGRVLWQASINDGTDPNKDNTHYTYEYHNDAQGYPVLDNIKVIEWLDKNVQGGIRSGNTDWYKEIMRQGYIINNNVTISNGSDNSSLLVSFGHYYNQGVVKFTDYGRYTGRINYSLNLFKKMLTIGENLQITTSSQTPLGNSQAGDQLNAAFVALSILPVYAEDGSFAGPIGPGFSNRNNPLQVANLCTNYKNYDKSAFGSIYMKFTPIKNLSFNSNLGIDYRLRESLIINPRYVSGFLSLAKNNYSDGLKQNNNWTWFNTLDYNFKIGEHTTNILAGTEAIAQNYTGLTAYKEDFLLENRDYFYIDAGTGLSSISGNGTGHKLISYFSKINYSYKSKYLATATVRYDGSSRFGEKNRYGFFPGISVGWRISAEKFFMDNISFVSNFMLRYGMGRTGNQEIGDNATLGIYRPNYGTMSGRRPIGSAYDLNGVGSGILPSGVVSNQTANSNLKWEGTNEVNLGIDYGFLNKKLSGSFDYFSRETTNILIQPPYIAVLGEGGAQWVNGATMKNKGWEFVLNYNDKIDDFNYNVVASLAHFRDEVTYLPETVIRSYAGNVEKTIIGHSLYSMFGYVTDGIFQNQEEVDASAVQPGKGVGRIRYKDLNGDGKIDVLDQDWLGTSIPDFEWGLNTILSYRNFTLTFFLQGVQGIKVQNFLKNESDLLGQFAGQNNTKRLLQAWTPQNTNSDIPAASQYDSNNEKRLSDYQIENASYMKLRNIQLGYNLPSRIQQSLGISQSSIYISASNLFTIKSNDFTSPDPENPSSWYPIPRSLTIGFTLAF